MKKRVLMPLLMASLLMGLAMIHSCTKNQDKDLKTISYKAFFESMDDDCPLMRNVISSDRAQYDCPYCHVQLHHNDTHWHYFGIPRGIKPPYGDDPRGFDVNEMMAMDIIDGHPRFWAVDACEDGLSEGSCPYSGVLYNDDESIQEVMYAYHHELGIDLTYEQAKELLAPRFHAHKIVYRAIVNGGMANEWHVGGGVPGWWPTPNIPQPNPQPDPQP